MHILYFDEIIRIGSDNLTASTNKLNILGVTIARKVLPRILKQMEILKLDKIYALGH